MNWMLAATTAAAVAGIAGYAVAAGGRPAADDRIFEMRTYTASPGKIAALHARFRDHTCTLFEKHGMTNIGYWQATTGDNAENTLFYILAFPSKEARDASWKAFQADEDWKKVKAESEKDGVPLAAKVVSVFMKPTDYSTIK
ncbi:MAG TPA: NIPSNAP family protein [Planctomycetota bacterium]|nr:NIPSNAP family protein [Planctomycetota bacterium]